MEHDAKFLAALFEFAEGDEKKSAEAFREFLEDNPPTQNDMLWALNVLRKVAGEGRVETLQNIDFVDEFVRLANKLDQPTQHPNSITLESPSGFRSDQGMNVQKRSQLGMSYCDASETYEKSASTLLYEALLEQGWKAITSLTGTPISSRGVPLKAVQNIAAEKGLTNDICHFKMGSLNRTMISPALQQTLSECVVSETLYPIQKGEREQSLFKQGSSSRFSSLVSLVRDKLVEKEIDPEIAIVKRNPKRSGHKPTCYTKLFQDVLQEFDIIRQPEEKPRLAVTVKETNIPINEQERENLADLISDSIIKRQNERVVPPSEEAVIIRYLASQPLEKALSRQ